jgi:hypothetical protein
MMKLPKRHATPFRGAGLQMPGFCTGLDKSRRSLAGAAFFEGGRARLIKPHSPSPSGRTRTSHAATCQDSQPLPLEKILLVPSHRRLLSGERRVRRA